MVQMGNDGGPAYGNGGQHSEKCSDSRQYGEHDGLERAGRDGRPHRWWVWTLSSRRRKQRLGIKVGQFVGSPTGS